MCLYMSIDLCIVHCNHLAPALFLQGLQKLHLQYEFVRNGVPKKSMDYNQAPH